MIHSTRAFLISAFNENLELADARHGRFAGWGGLQPEDGDVDVGIVLHPDYWGLGKELFDRITAFAFEEKGFESVIILLPPSRTRVKGVLRLGFQPDGETEIFGERFIRYRLLNPEPSS